MAVSTALSSQHWLEKDLLAQPGLNKKVKRLDKSTANNIAWLYWENRSFYITDMETKLVAVLDSCLSNKVQSLLRQANQQQTVRSSQTIKKPLVRVKLKSYTYSSMVNFQSKNRESYVFMIIDDMVILSGSGSPTRSTPSVKPSTSSAAEFVDNFDSKQLKIGSHPSLTSKTKPTPLSTVNTNVTPKASPMLNIHHNRPSILTKSSSADMVKKQPAPESLVVGRLKEKQLSSPPTNLSQLINELSTMSALQDYTIDLVPSENFNEPKKQSAPLDLNQAFFGNSIVASSSSSTTTTCSDSHASSSGLDSQLPAETRPPQLCSQLPAGLALNTLEFSVIEKESALQQPIDPVEETTNKPDNIETNTTSDLSDSQFADSTSFQFATSTLMIRDTQHNQQQARSPDKSRASSTDINLATMVVEKLISAPTEKVLLRNFLPQSTQALVPITSASSQILSPYNPSNLSIIAGSGNWDTMSNRSSFSTVSSMYSPSLFLSPSGKRKRKLLESVDSFMTSRPRLLPPPRLLAPNTPLKLTDKLPEMDAILEENNESPTTSNKENSSCDPPAIKKRLSNVGDGTYDDKHNESPVESSLSSDSTHDLDDSISLDGSRFGDDSDSDDDDGHDGESVLSKVPVKSTLFKPKHHFRAYSSVERRQTSASKAEQRQKTVRYEKIVEIFSPRNRQAPPPHDTQTDPIDRVSKYKLTSSGATGIGCHMVDKFIVFDKNMSGSESSPRKSDSMRRGLLKRRSLFDMNKQNLERAFADELDEISKNTTSSVNNTTTNVTVPPQEISSDKSIPSGQNNNNNETSIPAVEQTTRSETMNQTDPVSVDNHILNLRVNKNLPNDLQDYLISLKQKTNL